MKKVLLTAAIAAIALSANAQDDYKVRVDTKTEPVAEGMFQPTWESLAQYECPEWFKDAKFGIWAHWGPQCAPEDGDWYARNMYFEGGEQYQYQIDAMGHPSEKGFKDWIPLFTIENWNPDALVKLYADCGAKYFFTLANHHDNFDLWDSKYQPWNSVNMGPKRDMVGEWADAARKYGLRFGVSVHAAHAWTWYEPSKGADKKGPYAGVPYDGNLTKEDGKGTWWEGYDPQDLYEQRHELSKNNRAWDWQPELVTTPDQAYCDRFYNRTMDLMNRYSPDIVYYDDTVLPLWPFCDAGLQLTAHQYNMHPSADGKNTEGIVTGKVLNDSQKKSIMWDVERGAPDAIQEEAWQTCTCIGSWHYDKHIFYNDEYKSAGKVITMLMDVVSKNGNLLLSVPVRRDGTSDPTEEKIVKGIGAWLKVNGEGVYGTRPWKVFGEGPTAEAGNKISAQGFNEGRMNYTAADLRFTQKGKAVYVTVMGVPSANICVKSMAEGSAIASGKIKSIELIGSGEKVNWTRTSWGLMIEPSRNYPCSEAVMYKVTFK